MRNAHVKELSFAIRSSQYKTTQMQVDTSDNGQGQATWEAAPPHQTIGQVLIEGLQSNASPQSRAFIPSSCRWGLSQEPKATRSRVDKIDFATDLAFGPLLLVLPC